MKIIWKHVGETPLQSIEKFRREENISKDVKLAYAGRLDPMAEGKLLVLIGDECKQQDKYLKLDKEYEFEVLLGFESDTGDVLGFAGYEKISSQTDVAASEGTTKALTGKQTFQYPKFSSKTVKGKPLHVWTLEDKLDEIEIPSYESTIYKLTYLGERSIGKEDLLEHIITKIHSIPKVTAESKKLGENFRREKIDARWKELLKDTTENTAFMTFKFRCICSSGTYMRTLAEKIGKKLNSTGLAFSIKRTEIGRYVKYGPISFWKSKL